MKLIIQRINSYMMTQFLLSDPKLCAISLCDEHLKELDAGLGFTVPTECALGVYRNNELICCLLVSRFTDITYEWHIYLKTMYHSTGTSLEIKQAFFKWLKENTECKTVITSVPTVCTWVHKALLKNGARLVGTIPNGIIWRKKCTDLNLYSEEI